MSDLYERTRLSSLERVREVRRVLSAAKRPDAAAIDAALRELHAIKGETAMVGLKPVSRLAHLLESLLVARRSAPSPELGDAQDALRVLSEVLATTAAEDLDDSPDLADLAFEVEAAIDSDLSPGPVALREPTEAGAALAAAEEAPLPRRGRGEKNWSLVDAARIDELSALIAEIAAEVDAARAELGGVDLPSQGPLRRGIQGIGEHLASVRARVAQAEERAFGLRLVAIGPLFSELADHVEGLALELGKLVRVSVDAQSVALERSVVEALREPLLHLVRNAIDHGIEAPESRLAKNPIGTMKLAIESLGTETLVTVEDDGAGIDVSRLRRRAVETGMLTSERAARLSEEEVVDLIFSSGFSQRTEVSELSGRGVGLSAVRRSIEDLGGAVRVLRAPHGGTRFELVLPSSIARERVLLVEAADMLWAIPSRWIRLVVRDPTALAAARETGRLRTQEGLAVARPLGNWLGSRREDDSAAIVVEIAHRRVALLVPRALTEVELLRRPCEPVVSSAVRLAGSGTLADGRPVFFLRWAEVLREIVALGERSERTVARPTQKPHVLVADDSPVIRDIVGDILTGAGIEVTRAADGRAALEWTEKIAFDLVISDVEMPHMNGLELLTKIRQRTQLLPVVMLTTRSTVEHRREAALLGANAYIAKSEFQGESLLQVVRRFVGVES